MSTALKLFIALIALAHLSFQKKVVIDLGTGTVKAGFAGDAYPSVIVPNVVGIAPGDPTPYIGQEALDKASVLSLKRPMKDGFINDFENERTVLVYVFEELGVEPSQDHVTMTYSPGASSAMVEEMRSRLIDIGVPTVKLWETALMTLEFAGLKTGLVIETGFEGTFVVPVQNFAPIKSAIQKVDVGGNDITWYLSSLLEKDGIYFSTYAGLEWVDDVKQEYCYVAKNYFDEYADPVTFSTPWGDSVTIGDAQFKAPELLFLPPLNDINSYGLADAIYESLGGLDQYTVEQMLRNVVLGGGNSLLRGLKERLESELYMMNIIALDDREYSAWIGASMVTA